MNNNPVVIEKLFSKNRNKPPLEEVKRILKIRIDKDKKFFNKLDTEKNTVMINILNRKMTQLINYIKERNKEISDINTNIQELIHKIYKIYTKLNIQNLNKNLNKILIELTNTYNNPELNSIDFTDKLIEKIYKILSKSNKYTKFNYAFLKLDIKKLISLDIKKLISIIKQRNNILKDRNNITNFVKKTFLKNINTSMKELFSEVNRTFYQIGNHIDEHAKIYRKLFFLVDHFGATKKNVQYFDKDIYDFYSHNVFGKKWGFINPEYHIDTYRISNNNNDYCEFIIPNIESFNIDFKNINTNSDFYKAIGFKDISSINSTKDKIFKALCGYLIKIDIDFNLSEFKKKDMYLLEMAYYLIKDTFTTDLPLLVSSNYIGSGVFGKVYKKGNKIYKFENLRYENIMNKNNNTKISRIKYAYYNYMSSIIFINYIIQYYLHYINNKYLNSNNGISLWVPKIYDVDFNYQSNCSVTVMDLVLIGNNIEDITCDLHSFVKKECERESFVIDFFNILLELCNILIFFQDKCCFIHDDFKHENIMIKYHYDSNNNLSFKLNIIDFGFSCIIFKINNEKYMLKYINNRDGLNPNLDNPNISIFWYKKDLFTFFSRSIYEMQLHINVTKYKDIIDILINVLNIDTKYDDNFYNMFKKWQKILNDSKLSWHYQKYISSIEEKAKNNNPIISEKYKGRLMLMKIRNERNKLKPDYFYHRIYLVYLMTINKKMREEIYGKNIRMKLFDPRKFKIAIIDYIIPYLKKNNTTKITNNTPSIITDEQLFSI